MRPVIRRVVIEMEDGGCYVIDGPQITRAEIKEEVDVQDIGAGVRSVFEATSRTITLDLQLQLRIGPTGQQELPVTSALPS